MKLIFLTTAIVALTLASACQSNSNSPQINATPSGVHKIVIEEVMQTSNYTYLRVKEGEAEQSLAVPKMQASSGEIYYYEGGLLMTDFASKELNRTFKEVLFLDKLSSTPDIAKAEISPTSPNQNAQQTNVSQPGVHKVVVEEVLQTANYTYLRVKENAREQWLAVAKMNAAAGEVYYYQGGLLMTDFGSKELNRTFKEVLFLDKLSTSPTPPQTENSPASPHGSMPISDSTTNPNTTTEKKEIKLDHAKGEITISALFKNKQLYSGKIIKIKGEVTKFSPEIMNKNWIHLQDGTDNSGKFDLTVTTDIKVKVGDTVTLEGIISLNKDFGFGYHYEVIMEDAKLVK